MASREYSTSAAQPSMTDGASYFLYLGQMEVGRTNFRLEASGLGAERLGRNS